jgi:FAD/FMN-containing dehydrogenase
VAASLEYRLYPLATVEGGLIAHPLSAAKDLLRFYREQTQSVPDDLTVFAALAHAPDGSGMPLAAFIVCHTGSEEQAKADLEPFFSFGSPLVTQVQRMPYPVMNTLLDAGYPKGALNYWKSSFVRSIDDGLIDAMVDSFATCPSPMSAVVLEHFHGAVTRVPVSETPVPHRETGYNMVITGEWMDPADTDKNMAWIRSTYAAAEPSFASGRWLNYLADDDATDAVRAAYGQNYARLAAVKRTYDPNNLFRLNHNIAPV